MKVINQLHMKATNCLQIIWLQENDKVIDYTTEFKPKIESVVKCSTYGISIHGHHPIIPTKPKNLATNLGCTDAYANSYCYYCTLWPCMRKQGSCAHKFWSHLDSKLKNNQRSLIKLRLSMRKWVFCTHKIQPCFWI